LPGIVEEKDMTPETFNAAVLFEALQLVLNLSLSWSTLIAVSDHAIYLLGSEPLEKGGHALQSHDLLKIDSIVS